MERARPALGGKRHPATLRRLAEDGGGVTANSAHLKATGCRIAIWLRHCSDTDDANNNAEINDRAPRPLKYIQKTCI